MGRWTALLVAGLLGAALAGCRSGPAQEELVAACLSSPGQAAAEQVARAFNAAEAPAQTLSDRLGRQAPRVEADPRTPRGDLRTTATVRTVRRWTGPRIGIEFVEAEEVVQPISAVDGRETGPPRRSLTRSCRVETPETAAGRRFESFAAIAEHGYLITWSADRRRVSFMARFERTADQGLDLIYSNPAPFSDGGQSGPIRIRLSDTAIPPGRGRVTMTRAAFLAGLARPATAARYGLSRTAG